MIKGDLESLERAIGAVMDNAIKFSLDGGTIRIDVSKQDSRVVVKIVDQGIGITPEALGRVFDRFWRTEEHEGHLFGGVGLGLAIAKQVVEQHAGEIQVESEPGRGSTFVIDLPLYSSK
jgi:signal transduction histidine kinase